MKTRQFFGAKPLASATLSTRKRIEIVTFKTVIRNNCYPLAMFKRLKEVYQQYKPYVRVDLIMYGSLILMIIVYFIISVFI